MDVQQTISDFEMRAKAIGLPIQDLCEAAKINRATWQRWKSGAVSPLVHKLSRVEEALAAAEKVAAAATTSAVTL